MKLFFELLFLTCSKISAAWLVLLLRWHEWRERVWYATMKRETHFQQVLTGFGGVSYTQFVSRRGLQAKVLRDYHFDRCFALRHGNAEYQFHKGFEEACK